MALFELQVIRSEVRPLESGELDPVDGGLVKGTVLDLSDDRAIVKQGLGWPMRQNSLDLRRSDELLNRIPLGVASEDKPRHPVWLQWVVLLPLDSKHTMRYTLVHDKEVVHIVVASR